MRSLSPIFENLKGVHKFYFWSCLQCVDRISSSVVVVVALTAISGYTTPDQDLGNAIKIWRIVLAVLAWVAGLYGLILGLIAMLSLMSRMDFMEESFMKPFVNSGGKFLKQDTLLRN